MNNNIRISAFILVFLLSLFLPRLNAEQDLPFTNPQTAISMDFKDADLKDILKIFSVQSGLNFIASESVQDRKITLYLDKVPIQEAMDKLFKANNLSYELDKASNIFIVKDWGKPQVETITRVFYLKYATVSTSRLRQEKKNQLGSSAATGTDSTTSTSSAGSSSGGSGIEDKGIIDAVEKLLSESGSVVENARTNSLIVTDTPGRMAIIAQAIALLDISIPQVMLEVEMLDVNKGVVDKIGFEFGQTPFTAVLTGASMGTMWPFATTTLPFAAQRLFTPGSLAVDTGSNKYTAAFNFLRTQTDTKFLARPKILTLNNETAEIKIVTQEAVGEKKTVSGSAEATTTTEAERYETGVSLRVTPQINRDTGEITMFIIPSVSEATASGITSSSGVKFYNPEVRSTKSIVKVKDGETVVLGGLIRNKKTTTVKKLPVLGDIPLIGLLFRYKDLEPNSERELLVFITPRIVKDTNIELAQAKKVSLPEREQSTASGIDRSDAINSSLNNFEKKKK